MTTSPKKISYLITKATWGGAQRYVFDLATELPKAQFCVEVIYGETGRLAQELANAGIHKYQLPVLGRNVALISDFKSFVHIWRYLRYSRPDIVHLNSSKAAALGALAARLRGVKRIVFTAHGWPHKEPRNALARSFIYIISWLTALMSHEVIVVSRDDEDIAMRMPLIASRTHYIPIGRALQHMYTRDEAWLFFRGVAPHLRKFKKSPRIITVAELTENKGIRYGIEAVSLLAKRGVDCLYVIAGGGEQHDALLALAARLGIADRVALPGFVKDAGSYLSAFDIFLLPSLKEGMPYVLLEAGDAQLPIVTTTAANPEIAETYERVSIVEPGNAHLLADALEEAIRAGAQPQRSIGESRFSLRQMIDRTIALY